MARELTRRRQDPVPFFGPALAEGAVSPRSMPSGTVPLCNGGSSAAVPSPRRLDLLRKRRYGFIAGADVPLAGGVEAGAGVSLADGGV